MYLLKLEIHLDPKSLCYVFFFVTYYHSAIRGRPIAGDNIALAFFTLSTFLSLCIVFYHETFPHCGVEGKKRAKQHLLCCPKHQSIKSSVAQSEPQEKKDENMNLLIALAKLTPWHKDARLHCPAECTSSPQPLTHWNRKQNAGNLRPGLTEM